MHQEKKWKGKPTEDVGVISVLNRRKRNLGKWAHTLNPSIVDKHIDPSEPADNVVKGAPHALIGLNIELLQEEPGVVLQVRHAGPRPAGGHHRALVRRERACQRVAYPSIRATRYENHRLVVVVVVVVLAVLHIVPIIAYTDEVVRVIFGR